MSNETARLRAIQDKQAPSDDGSMDIFERLLFRGARESACGRLERDVLEIAIGTGRKMALNPPGVRVTGVEVSEGDARPCAPPSAAGHLSGPPRR